VAANLIVALLTLIMLGIVAVWIVRSGTRVWIEAPKYQSLQWDQTTPADDVG
jgi:hypothetical protein